LRERHLVRIAENRNDEAAFGSDGDADVVVMLDDNLVALHFRIQQRKCAQRGNAGLHEERRDPERYAVLRLEGVPVAFAERHHRAHVDLVERGEHRRVVLCFDQPPRNRGAAL